MLKIKEGSVFDEKCDLLVLPCNSGGGVTPWVRHEAQENDVPLPQEEVPFGRVLFQPTAARYPKADFVGFAASVDARVAKSTLKAIDSILDDILGYCRTQNCTMTNLPVLGAGAGRLDPSHVLDVYRRRLDKEQGVFNVFIQDARIAQLFVDRQETREAPEDVAIEHPRVFISYSRKDPVVNDWVVALARKLCDHGVDARLDRFHLKPGMDLPQWMTNELLKARKVLLVSDVHYAAKADARTAGVGWETMIIQGDMMMQGEMDTKYIVIAFGDAEKTIPIYMRSKFSITRDEVDNSFDRLLDELFGVDTAPVIRPIPRSIQARLKSTKLP